MLDKNNKFTCYTWQFCTCACLIWYTSDKYKYGMGTFFANSGLGHMYAVLRTMCCPYTLVCSLRNKFDRKCECSLSVANSFSCMCR